MAASGTATLIAGLGGQSKVEKTFEVDLTNGAVAFIITLDTTFSNTPKMLAVPELGADGAYSLAYTAGTPSMTLTVSGETNLPTNGTVTVFVVAYDQP